MHETRKRAFELVLPCAEVGDALARLTAEASQGRLTLGEHSIPFDDWSSLKISCKAVGPSCLVKVRLRAAAAGDLLPAGEAVQTSSPHPGGGGRYKSLKKRMKETFKILTTALTAGQRPDPAIVAAFIADSRSMTTFSGKGDEYYPAYDTEVGRLEEAAAAGDVAAMSRCAAELARMKKECHRRYA
jgi:XXXCH domain-containing protein